MTRLALRNPIAVLMVSIALLVFSAVVTPRMSVDTFPQLTPPVLVVATTMAPGMGPKDVEKTLTWRLEKYVSATPGLERVESVSKNGLSLIYVWLKWGTDLSSAQILVQQQVAFAMAAVPKSLGVVPPFVLQYDPANAPVCQILVAGGGLTGAQLYDFAFNNIQPLIEGIPGVASAAPAGGRQRQINIVVDPMAAQARGVTAVDVAQAVAQSNALLPSGVFLAPGFHANVYTNAVPEKVKAIGEAVVKVSDGHPVYIADVAKVDDGGSPETQATSINGQDAVTLAVLRVPGGNTLAIVDAVKQAVANLQGMPPGMEVKVVFDQSVFVRATYTGLKSEIARALALIAIVILLFLQSLRGTLIVSVAIPLSFAIALIVLYASGQTLNAFTLGGLTLAMGRLVDDAVVVLESIHRERSLGKSALDAARDGTEAVALPVLASTLTTIAVLVPVTLLSGLAQRLFAPLAITVAVSMVASYFVSVAVTPVACRYFLGHAPPGRVALRVAAAVDGVALRYAATLRRALSYRGAIVVACVLLTAAAGVLAGRMPSTLFPEIDESQATIYVRLPSGVSLEDSQRKIDAMGKAVRAGFPAGTIDVVYANVGTPTQARTAIGSPNHGPHTGFIQLALSDPHQRKVSQREIADGSRRILREQFPGVEIVESPGGLVAGVFSGGHMAPIVVEVRNENLNILADQARNVADVARTIGGIADVRVSLETDYPELRVEVRRDEASLVGVTARASAQGTLDATLGNINTPSVWVDPSNGQSYYVVTGWDTRKVNDPNALAQIPARVTDDAKSVTLGSYGQIRRSTGPIAIERNELQRVARVVMQTERRDIGSAAADLERALGRDVRTIGIKTRFVGEVALMRSTFDGIGLAVALAIMLVFMIMASQFKSLKLPFVMLFTIPVALVGIVLTLLVAGHGFSITALMGVLMVVGIAVSNGILLVEDAHRRRGVGGGASAVDAVVAAAASRFKPIAMTSLATIVGLLPTALGLEHGTESNQPLALAVVGGLTSSTLLSLFLLPAIYTYVAAAPVTPPPP